MWKRQELRVSQDREVSESGALKVRGGAVTWAVGVCRGHSVKSRLWRPQGSGFIKMRSYWRGLSQGVTSLPHLNDRDLSKWLEEEHLRKVSDTDSTLFTKAPCESGNPGTICTVSRTVDVATLRSDGLCPCPLTCKTTLREKYILILIINWKHPVQKYMFQYHNTNKLYNI